MSRQPDRQTIKRSRKQRRRLNSEQIAADTEAFLAAGGTIQKLHVAASSWNEDQIEYLAKKLRYDKLTR